MKKLIFETLCPNCECEIEVNAVYDGNLAEKLARTERMLKVAKEALEVSNQFWEIIAESDDASYCHEYAREADLKTHNALAEIERIASEGEK